MAIKSTDQRAELLRIANTITMRPVLGHWPHMQASLDAEVITQAGEDLLRLRCERHELLNEVTLQRARFEEVARLSHHYRNEAERLQSRVNAQERELERLRAVQHSARGLSLEDYLLVCLVEECAEISHAVAKSLRFGLNHEWPGRGVTNKDAIRDELRDAFRLAGRLDVDNFIGLPDKGEKFRRMMELSRSLGRLQGNIDA